MVIALDQSKSRHLGESLCVIRNTNGSDRIASLIRWIRYYIKVCTTLCCNESHSFTKGESVSNNINNNCVLSECYTCVGCPRSRTDWTSKQEYNISQLSSGGRENCV